LPNQQELPVGLPTGIVWGALGINAEIDITARLEIGTKDEKTARALHLWVTRLGELIASTTDIRNVIPQIDRVARMLMPNVEQNRLTIHIDAEMTKKLAAMMTSSLQKTLSTALAERSKNGLRQLALAIHNFHDVHKQFPSAALQDTAGKPLLSWRVAVLPYLEQPSLYQEFHLNEPWDSEHNKQLIAKMPEVFAPANAELRAQGKTTFVVPVGRENDLWSEGWNRD
jgi:hypothetical protein